jgi:hypothetical protein
MCLINGDGADGLRVFVEDRLERGAAVNRLPDAAARRADVENARIVSDAVEGGDAPAGDGRADVASFDCAERRGVNFDLAVLRSCEGNQ